MAHGIAGHEDEPSSAALEALEEVAAAEPDAPALSENLLEAPAAPSESAFAFPRGASAPRLPALQILENVPRTRPELPSAPGTPPAFILFGVAMFAASAGDLASTEIALQEPNRVEANPLQRNREIRIAAHVAAPAVLWWITERARRERPKLALIVRIGFTVAYSYAVMHNLRVNAAH